MNAIVAKKTIQIGQAARNASEKRTPTMGMSIQGGAAPVQPDAGSHPNHHHHHLIVHVFDRKTRKAMTDARVNLNFEPLDSRGNSAGPSIDVPVVVMQEIGVGPKSTNYGNNATMPAGSYHVTVTVNSKTADFLVMAGDAPSNSGGFMGGMKMQ
jgi:hypothetical protein